MASNKGGAVMDDVILQIGAFVFLGICSLIYNLYDDVRNWFLESEKVSYGALWNVLAIFSLTAMFALQPGSFGSKLCLALFMSSLLIRFLSESRILANNILTIEAWLKGNLAFFAFTLAFLSVFML